MFRHFRVDSTGLAATCRFEIVEISGWMKKIDK